MAIPSKQIGNFVETLVDDEVLLVTLSGGELLSLSGTGRAAWEAIDGARSVGDIADRLAVEFAASREEIAADVAALIDELARAGLVSVH